ncbi:MAG: hypothetical protein EBZ59_00905 [Planctomycetia bacterium]|nr:hypothetical protein [Planctomycetia bacterium]
MTDGVHPPQEPRDGAGPHKLRRRIAREAARLMAEGADSTRSRLRAARRVARGWVPEEHLPSHEEIRREIPDGAADRPTAVPGAGDRFDRLADMVRVLSTVRPDPVAHPEGDLLEHSLQVFDRVRDERPFDEELLTAALVHDVGRAIDRQDDVAAAVESLGDLITPRTRWLIESLPAARAHADNTLGRRARQRLEAHADFLDVLLLAEADRRGHVRGYDAPSLEEAIAFLRGLESAPEETAPAADPRAGQRTSDA